MKNIFLLIVTLVLFPIGITGTATATPLLNLANDGFEDNIDTTSYAYYANSGEFMFVKNNENNDGVNLNDGTVAGYVKDWLSTYYPSIFNLDDFTLTPTTSIVTSQSTDGESGTWAVIPSSDVISFYAVKADNDYAMYFVNPADNTGSWSTYDLFVDPIAHPATSSGLEISHFTLYKATSTPVPEPATLLLFGTGLAGLAGFRSREKIQ